MRAGIIGAGKVGFSLGKYLVEHGIPVTGYYSRNPASAKEASEFTATGFFENLTDIVKDSDTLFITVPDGAIGDVWDDMGDLTVKGKNICHCSGSVSSAVFFHAEDRGACRYSIHPLYAVSDRYTSWKDLGKAHFTIEGSQAHLEEMAEVFRSLGNRVTIMENSEKKAIYHAAAVMVSNQMAALAELGVQLLTTCGFTREDAETALAPLITGNALKIGQVGPVEALTGPIERGDAETVRKHLDAMEEENLTEIRKIYEGLSRVLVEMAEKKHPERDYRTVKEILKGNEEQK